MAGHEKFGSEKTRKRVKRKFAIRKRITGTAERPRLSVFRSAKHVYAQAIDDVTGRVLAAASDTEASVKQAVDGKPKKERARSVGKAIGEKLVALKVT
jgi:large subunit ribosomal protein L18